MGARVRFRAAAVVAALLILVPLSTVSAAAAPVFPAVERGVVRQPVRAEAGSRFLAGAVWAALDWHLPARRVVDLGPVSLEGSSEGGACAGHRRVTVVAVTAQSEGLAVDIATRRVTGGRRQLPTEASLRSPRPIDVVVVQVCRSQRRPWPSDCGTARGYAPPAPPPTTPARAARVLGVVDMLG